MLTSRFYLLEVSNKVANFLGDLQQATNETGIDLDVVEWDLEENLKDWTVLWDYGALLALTDCVYRSMKDHGLAYVVDLDEFIVPQVNWIWTHAYHDIAQRRKDFLFPWAPT